MITTEEYCEKYIDDTYRLPRVIRILTIEIRRLKKMIEKTYSDPSVMPILGDEYESIIRMKEYLAKAKDKYSKISDSNLELSYSEQKSADFNERIPYINRIYFEICSSDGDVLCRRNISFDEDDVWFDSHYDKGVIAPPSMIYENYTKDLFLDNLRSLDIGEWKFEYNASKAGRDMHDGKSWKLEISYFGGLPSFYSKGINACPYNFFSFEQLLDISILR